MTTIKATFNEQEIIDLAFQEIKAHPFKIADDVFLKNLIQQCVDKAKESLKIVVE